MTISSKSVMELRDMTGAGMMDCKRALTESQGDFDKAVEYLRTKGLAAAEKRQGRVAAEGLITSYVHNGKIGVLVEVNCETDFVARNQEFQNFTKDVAMHIAAANPKFLKVEDIDEGFREKERRIYVEQLREQGRPEQMIPKIVEGKLNKMAEEVCLLEQKFVKDPDKTIKALLADLTLKLGEKLEIRRFVKFHLGEGIDRPKSDFSDEVNKIAKS